MGNAHYVHLVENQQRYPSVRRGMIFELNAKQPNKKLNKLFV